jgi:hypothetical protein
MPRRAVWSEPAVSHSAARAASYPFLDSEIDVISEKPVDPNQWWVTYTPQVEVAPVSLAELSELMVGHLILKGKPSHYLPPVVVRGILERAVDLDRLTKADRLVFQLPVGSADLPNPALVWLAGWRKMADGPLKAERQVEQYVVDPLLRPSLPKPRSVRWEKPYRLNSGIADYVVLEPDSHRP